MGDLSKLIQTLPKAELHLHIEGTLEPELMFKISKENNVKIPYSSVEEIRRAYNFKNLQDFLNIYYNGMSVLNTQDDFELLTLEYLERANAQNVKHVEISFDPQAHINRGMSFDIVAEGMLSGLKEGEKKYGISWVLILSILRDLSVNSALQTLELAESYLNEINALGLDSAELGNPPSKFKGVFKKAEDLGLLKVAHAGEEGPPEYVWEAINILKVDRIDHGVRTIEAPNLLKELGRMKMPFTLCPLSNLKLNVVKDLATYPLREFVNAGIIATVNSDDPAYFGGYVNENYEALQKALHLSGEEIIALAKNSIIGSFALQSRKEELLRKIKDAEKSWKNGRLSF